MAERWLGIRLLGEGSHALSASGDRTLKLWDVSSERSVLSLSGHSR